MDPAKPVLSLQLERYKLLTMQRNRLKCYRLKEHLAMS